MALIIKLFFLYKKENAQGTRWKTIFYVLTLLISILIMMPNLNSPAPDITCGILIMYSFIMLMNLAEKGNQQNLVQIVLLNLVVYSCITFKISSLFLIVTILFVLNKDFIRSSKYGFHCNSNHCYLSFYYKKLLFIRLPYLSVSRN
jgi:hypothetical protein